MTMYDDELMVAHRADLFSKLADASSLNALKIYVYIMNKASNSGLRTVVVTYAELEDVFCIGRSTVCRSLKYLKDCKLIKRGLNPSEIELCEPTKIYRHSEVL